MTKEITQKDEIMVRDAKNSSKNVRLPLDSQGSKKEDFGVLDYTEFLIYNSPNGEVKVEVFLHNEDVWLTQKRMAELFDVQIPIINEHLKNIFSSEELDENSVIRKFLTTASDRKKYNNQKNKCQSKGLSKNKNFIH